MGAVYRGTHVLMDKTVAVKVLRPSLAADEKIVARFSREARAASRISHPNALSVTDFGEAEDGIVFLVMEFLNGRTLKDVIREEGPLPLERVVNIMQQVADALTAAHEQGVVHRDLKSDNIMLMPTAVGEHAKVLDFGIAKINEPDAPNSELTAPNLVIGTPQYMSPEQCSQAGEIDSRSDIYSLGVILFEMLVGHVPFSGESPTIVMMKHMQDPVPSVLNERDDVPRAIEQIISKALAKVPANRYQKVTELLEDLMIASGATPPSTSGSFEKSDSAPARTTTTANDDDEVTVVRPRQVEAIPPPAAVSGRRAPVTVPIAPPPPPARSTFNPVKILIPATAALLTVFALFYIFTRSPAPASTDNANTQPGLIADPNSQPVQAASPPTGQAESGIPAGGGNINASNQNANVNANVSPTVSPEVVVPSPTANTNTNSNKETTLPSPTRTASPVEVPLPSPPAPTPKTSPAQPNPTPTVPPQ
jgi:serine/threonine-protein kinase